MTTLAEQLALSGMELAVSRYLEGEPSLERDSFSGGVNLSARKRNHERLSKACRVFTIDSMPSKVFCAPWVYELIQTGMGPNADDRIDKLYALWRLTGRGRVAIDWKIGVAERMRAKQMSDYFWKRNPRTEQIEIETI